MWYTVTLVVGVVLLLISLFKLRESINFLRNSERATATVIDLERVRGSDGDTYKPIFKFKTRLNQEIIHRSSASSNPPGWEVGEEAIMAYDGNDPSEARVLTYFGTFSWTIILMSIAMPMLVIGGGYYLAQGILK